MMFWVLGPVAAEVGLDAFNMSHFAASPSQLEPSRPSERLNFLSAVFGDHMVLQRAPQQAMLYGFTTPGATVKTLFDGQALTSTSDVNGTWRQLLPATDASEKAYTIKVASSTGEGASLTDVLFGDVYLCGGQSNMQFALLATENATEEIQIANAYPHIRLFTVGQGTNTPGAQMRDLQTIEQNWSVAANSTIAGGGGFGYFSSVCWFFGRRLSNYLKESTGATIPLGLVSNNWGGTTVEQWSPDSAYAVCNRTQGNNGLYNAMIVPYTVGPFTIKGFTWYQGA